MPMNFRTFYHNFYTWLIIPKLLTRMGTTQAHPNYLKVQNDQIAGHQFSAIMKTR